VVGVLVIAVWAAVALVYIASPLAGGTSREQPDGSALFDEADARKRAALVAIIDIEDEKEVGKLSQVDFDILRTEYEAEALTALAELDALSPGAYSDDDIEAEIAAMRARLVCPSCGALRQAGTVCERCGS
jgi:hypothetical protein